jgi:multiple sugar transport system substrate-binding protein
VSKKLLSRRDFLKAAAASGAAGAFAAAGVNLSAVVAAQDAVTLRKMAWGSPLEQDNILAGLADFMEQNPGINVEYIHTPERYQEVLQTMLAAGDAPDVYKLGNYYPDLALRGALMDITDLVQSDEVLGDPDYFFPFENERSSIDGRWYAIGSTFQWRLIYYNKTVLDAAGVTPPSTNPAEAWSWDTFIENARLLTMDSAGNHPGDAAFNVDDVVQWGFFAPDVMYDNYIISNGGVIIDADSHEYVLDQPAAYEAVQAFADLRLTHTVAPQASMLDQMGMNAWQMLASGRVAMIQDGNWALQDISKLDMEFGVAVLPILQQPGTITGSSWTGIYSQTQFPEQSWELFRYLNLDAYQSGLVRSGLWGVSHTTLLTPEGIDLWWDEAVHPENWLPLENDYKFNYGHVVPNVLGTLRTGVMLTNGLAEVWIGTRTAEDVLKELNPQLNATLAEEQANL